MPTPGEDEREEAKLSYVGATQQLIIGLGWRGLFGQRLLVQPVNARSAQSVQASRLTLLGFDYGPFDP